MSLDPPMTAKQTRELAQKRQLERYGRVVDAFAFRLETPGTCLVGDVRPDGFPFHASTPLRAPNAALLRAEAESPVRVRRWANGCHVAINLPPRTKKNHGCAFGIKQSAAYKHFRDTIVKSVALWSSRCALPLEDRPYNLAAVYYVDSRGKSADLFGLHDGLADALQNAGVVSRDWWFRTADGSRVVFDDPNPRVEALITAIGAP